MNIYLSSLTDVGLERENNEDAVAICPSLSNQDWQPSSCGKYIELSSLGALSVLVDGMGGANAGEVAAAIAVETIKGHFTDEKLKEMKLSSEVIQNYIRSTILDAHQAIIQHGQQHNETEGMGTTIVIVWILEKQAYIAWCGDSRCYRFNPEKGLKQLTKDHSYVQDLIDEGTITSEEAFTHPDNNIITRCLGDVETACEPDILSYEIRPGDIFLSCSDGLCGYCKDKEIETIMYQYYDKLDCCRDQLLNLALKAGGYDNITISLCATLPDNMHTVKTPFFIKIKRWIHQLFC